jgi:high-affinity K+ transport system ATPase subunit B
MSAMTQVASPRAVVRDGVLCGIVGMGDMVKHGIVGLEKHRNELVDYMNARWERLGCSTR